MRVLLWAWNYSRTQRTRCRMMASFSSSVIVFSETSILSHGLRLLRSVPSLHPIFIGSIGMPAMKSLTASLISICRFSLALMASGLGGVKMMYPRKIPTPRTTANRMITLAGLMFINPPSTNCYPVPCWAMMVG